ncbi:MAG: hypothetical protein IT428_10615 [Planctomycetaceae bacterium]|nr:hypothetical protein [Planctomycetaceae bacterium]
MLFRPAGRPGLSRYILAGGGQEGIDAAGETPWIRAAGPVRPDPAQKTSWTGPQPPQG